MDGTHLCTICGVNYANSQELREHNWSLMHHIKYEHKEGKGVLHVCSLCNKSFKNLTDYGKHLNEMTHKNNVEDDRRALNGSPDSTNESLQVSHRERSNSWNASDKQRGRGGKSSRRGNYNPSKRGRGGHPNHGHFHNTGPGGPPPNFWQDDMNTWCDGWNDFSDGSPGPYGYPLPNFNNPPPWRGRGGFPRGRGSFYPLPPADNSSFNNRNRYQYRNNQYDQLTCSEQSEDDNRSTSSRSRWEKNSSTSETTTKPKPKTVEKPTFEVDEPKNSLSNKASKLIDDILSGKTVARASGVKEKEETVTVPTSTADSSCDILQKAQDLCTEMKKKRARMEAKLKDQEATKVRMERDKWNKEAEKFQKTNESLMSGILNDSRLSSVSSAVSRSRISILDSDRPHLSDTLTSKSSMGRSSNPGSSFTSSTSTVMSSHSRSRIPQISKSMSKSENILKLINSPRSRKEKIEVAKFLQDHKKKQHRPKLSNLDKESGDIDVDSLPEDIKLQINQLIDEVMTDLDVTTAAESTTQNSQIINIVPDDSEAEPSPLFTHTFPSEKAFDFIEDHHTSTPVSIKSTATATRPSEMSAISTHHTSLFGEPHTETFATTQPESIYADSALHEFSKRLDAEISTIASLHSATSGLEDSTIGSQNTSTNTVTHSIREIKPELDVSSLSIDVSHPTSSRTTEKFVMPEPIVPDPIAVVDRPVVARAEAAAESFSIVLPTPNPEVEPEGASKSCSKRRRDQKHAKSDIFINLDSPENVSSPEKDQSSKRQRVENQVEVIELDSEDDNENDCTMDMLYTISLEEEEVRGKITNTNDAIIKLENLLKKTQEQLRRRLETKEKLEEEEKILRKKRMKLLKGAVNKSSSTSVRSEPASDKNESSPKQQETTDLLSSMRTPVVKLERCDELPAEPDSTVGSIQVINHTKEEPEPATQPGGLQYLGTLGSVGLDQNLLEQLSDNFVIMEESQFKKCLSDSAMSQDSEDDPTAVADDSKSPPVESPETGVFKKPEPVKSTRPKKDRAAKQSSPSKASSMTNLNTIQEAEEGITCSQTPKGKSAKSKTKGSLSDSETASRGRRKKKKKEGKVVEQQVPSDSSSAVQNVKKSKPGKYQKYKPEVQQMIKDYLHATSSSDVSLSGLELNTSQQSSGSKKKAKKSRRERNYRKSSSRSPSQTSEVSESEEESNRSDATPSVSLEYAAKHTGPVKVLLLYGKYLVTGGNDSSIHRFRCQSGKEASTEALTDVFKIRGQVNDILSACIDDSAPKKPLLYTGNGTNMLQAFDIKSGKIIKNIRYASKVTALTKCTSQLYVGLANGTVLTLDLKTGNNIDAYRLCDGPVNCLAAAKEGARNLLCVAGPDCSISVRDAKNSLLLRSLEGHTKPPTCLKVRHHFVFSGGPDGLIQIHNLNTGEAEMTIRIGDTISSLCLSKNGYLFAGGANGIVRMFNNKEYVQQQIYYASAGVTCMAINNEWLHIGSKDGTVEAIQIGNKQWHCGYGRCRLICGRKEDLQRHCLMDHISPGGKNTDKLCLWKECGVSLSMKDSKKERETVKHIADHIEEISLS